MNKILFLVISILLVSACDVKKITWGQIVTNIIVTNITVTNVTVTNMVAYSENLCNYNLNFLATDKVNMCDYTVGSRTPGVACVAVYPGYGGVSIFTNGEIPFNIQEYKEDGYEYHYYKIDHVRVLVKKK
jgi:hypothetical protein